MSSSSSVLECRAVSARYGRITVCSGVSFEVSAGEIVTLLGPNGAGKTSLLGYISGMVSGSGSVIVRGQNVSVEPAYMRARRGLRLVPEGRGLFRSMTVERNLELGARLAAPKERGRLIDRAISLFPILEQRMSQNAGDMSGGEQQMLAVAKAIAGDPSVLMLDEPTQGLAPQVFSILREALFSLRDDGLAIVLVEQRHAFAETVADRRLVLVGGRLVYRGDSAEPLGRDALMRIYTEGEAA